MRTIPANILTEIAKTQFTEFSAVKITIDSVDYCFSDADTPIIIDGDRYEPRGFTFQPISYSKANIVDRASLEMENLDEIFTSLFVGSTVQGETVEIKKVIISI